MVPMSAMTSTPQPVSAPGNPSYAAETDASCRWPLFALFLGGAIWLLVASGFGMIASIKFHAPGFLADDGLLTYGRVHPAAFNALVYGFCLPAGFGVGLWLMARLGQVRLLHPFLTFLGAIFWHVGVLVGLAGILEGDATGFPGLDMPRYAAVPMFAGSLLIALCAALTLYERRERTLFPAQWFVFAGLLWFPWIYSSANLVLLFFPARGVVQSSVHWWYLNNLTVVWLSLMGLAATFYFVSKLTDRPLHSRYLALFTFWGFILLGS
ncbi:MAG TPA: cbb3-type cytochrome c oxidase subunit I, partial [Verrucomicrobiae bacterium]|nr:cbb3-type cytochrome c oxidase subunit I [Verrucomicrobiae bacterium]